MGYCSSCSVIDSEGSEVDGNLFRLKEGQKLMFVLNLKSSVEIHDDEICCLIAPGITSFMIFKGITSLYQEAKGIYPYRIEVIADDFFTILDMMERLQEFSSGEWDFERDDLN